ncbi:MAG: hypothetical protein GY866_22685 [Proteobacteria bacterium]|nr:hypothetical protein [Pseudomonadota bacterium]
MAGKMDRNQITTGQSHENLLPLPSPRPGGDPGTGLLILVTAEQVRYSHTIALQNNEPAIDSTSPPYLSSLTIGAKKNGSNPFSKFYQSWKENLDG